MFGQSEKNILVAGHRGYKVKYPENTMLSFKKAIELGVDMIEMDVNLSKDRVPVVIHDLTLERTTNGKGYVRDFTLKELQALDAGSYMNEAFSSCYIPTLTEFLDLVTMNKHLYLNVEIKEKTFETVDLTIKELERYHLLNKIVMTCFDANIISYINKNYGIKTQGFPNWYMQNFHEDTYKQLYSVGIQMKDLHKELCDYFKGIGIDPWGYCPDTDESINQVITSGCTLITCNNPEPAIRILKEKGLHK